MRTIRRITGASAIEAGHAIQFVLEMDDGSRETLRCPFHTASTLAQIVIQAGAAAATLQQRLPGQPLAFVEAYRATNSRTGSAGETVVVEFSTDPGPPVQVAMTSSLAEKTIERLSATLANLGTQPPSAKN